MPSAFARLFGFRNHAPLVAAVGIAIAHPALGQVLIDLQTLPISDEFSSEAFAVSGDGLVLGGRGRPSQDAWILDDSFMTTFLLPGYGPSEVNGLSHDGSVAVGWASAGGALRWTPDIGATALGDLVGGSGSSSAQGVSADGTIVVGAADSPGGVRSSLEAFRWTLMNPVTGQGTMVGLGDLPGGDSYSVAAAVSQDGLIVVGGASSAASYSGSVISLGFEAFRWSQGTGMEPLGDLPGGGYYSIAHDVSADGSVVVGESTSAASGSFDMEAFRWTQQTGMVGLGDLPGGNFTSFATGVSADGSIIIGSSAVAIGDGGFDVYAPFIWDAVHGMRDLRNVFAELGLTLPLLAMTNATDISDDGRTITGFGKSVYSTPGGSHRTEAWVGVLSPVQALLADFDIDGDVDGADFLTWQRGESPNPLSQSDLADWEANYGTVAPLTATSTTVPEPATGLMLTLGMVVMIAGCRTAVSELIR